MNKKGTIGIFTKSHSSHLKYLFFLSELPSALWVWKFICETVVTADGVCTAFFGKVEAAKIIQMLHNFYLRENPKLHKANAEEERRFLESSNPGAVTEGHLYLWKLAASWSAQMTFSATACASQLFPCLLVLNYAHKNDWPSRDPISQSLKRGKFRLG